MFFFFEHLRVYDASQTVPKSTYILHKIPVFKSAGGLWFAEKNMGNLGITFKCMGLDCACDMRKEYLGRRMAVPSLCKRHLNSIRVSCLPLADESIQHCHPHQSSNSSPCGDGNWYWLHIWSYLMWNIRCKKCTRIYSNTFGCWHSVTDSSRCASVESTEAPKSPFMHQIITHEVVHFGLISAVSAQKPKLGAQVSTLQECVFASMDECVHCGMKCLLLWRTMAWKDTSNFQSSLEVIYSEGCASALAPRLFCLCREWVSSIIFP